MEISVSFEEAMQQVNAAPILRKFKAYLDKSNMSSDMKATLYDIAGFSIEVGERMVAVGRRIFEIASGLVVKFPNFTLTTLVAVVIGVVLNGALGGLPIIGALLLVYLSQNL